MSAPIPLWGLGVPSPLHRGCHAATCRDRHRPSRPGVKDRCSEQLHARSQLLGRRPRQPRVRAPSSAGFLVRTSAANSAQRADRLCCSSSAVAPHLQSWHLRAGVSTTIQLLAFAAMPVSGLIPGSPGQQLRVRIALTIMLSIYVAGALTRPFGPLKAEGIFPRYLREWHVRPTSISAPVSGPSRVAPVPRGGAIRGCRRTRSLLPLEQACTTGRTSPAPRRDRGRKRFDQH